MTTQRMFPIQRQWRQWDTKAHPLLIPWHIAELAYSVYSARYGTSQSLERLAERGGFGPGEMDMFLPDWRERCDENAKLRAKLAEALAVLEPLERLLLMSAPAADNIVRVVIELSDRHGYEVTAKFPEWETRRGPTLAEALKTWSPPNRCPCGFPHPAHDYCDGNPNGSSFGGIAERLGNKPQA